MEGHPVAGRVTECQLRSVHPWPAAMEDTKGGDSEWHIRSPAALPSLGEKTLLGAPGIATRSKDVIRYQIISASGSSRKLPFHPFPFRFFTLAPVAAQARGTIWAPKLRQWRQIHHLSTRTATLFNQGLTCCSPSLAAKIHNPYQMSFLPCVQKDDNAGLTGASQQH